MGSRGVFAIALLSSALVSGGWFVERGLVTGRASAPGDAPRLFDEVFQRVERDYVDTLPDSTLYLDAVGGLLDELHDPHSVYLSPKRLASLSESTSGTYVGVGTQIDIRDGWITIIQPLPGGPAEQAGLRAGDRIIAVNGAPLHDVTAEEAQQALRGRPGSVARLTIERPGAPATLAVSLTRREILVQSVQHPTLLGDGIGYVALTIFSARSATDLSRAVDSLQRAGMRALLLDLRGNPGGLLDQGVGVADLFLDTGQRIVSMRGRTPDADRAYDDHSPQRWPTLPIAVLVDSNTASAAEIVTGALQDHDRALVLGTTTYGKGSAQRVFPTANGGAVKLTTALWYTPSGRSIDRHRAGSDTAQAADSDAARPRYHTDDGRVVLGGGGITPDVVITDTSLTAADSALQQALAGHVSELRDALTADALALKAAGTIRDTTFAVTPAMRVDLLRRLQSRGVAVDTMAFARAAPVVDELLGDVIARYVFGDRAAFDRQLREDGEVQRTLAIMRGATTQAALLAKAK